MKTDLEEKRENKKKIKREKIPKGTWVSGVPDRSNVFPTRCKICKRTVNFQFYVDDETWKAVVPPYYRRFLICLECTDKLCVEQGIDIAEHLLDVWYCGVDKTILLDPEKEYYWDTKRRKIEKNKKSMCFGCGSVVDKYFRCEECNELFCFDCISKTREGMMCGNCIEKNKHEYVR